MKILKDFVHQFSTFSNNKDQERAFWKSLIYISLFSLFINLLMLAPPLYMLQVYDRVMSSRSQETLLFISLILIWMFLTLGILEYVRSRILAHTAFSIDQYLAPDIFSAIHKNALKNPEHANNQALNDLATVRQFLSGHAPFAFFDIPWTPIYLGLLFLFDPLFGWFAVGAAIVLIILALFNELSTVNLQKKSAESQYIASNMVNATLRNSEVIHAMGMEEQFKKRWKIQYQNALHGHSQVSQRSGLFISLSKTLRMLFQSLILGLGAYLAINNHITAGMMIAGSIIMGRALAPIDQIIGAWKQFVSARAGVQRLHEFLEQQHEEADHMSLPDPKGHIMVNNVVLKPPGSKNYSLKGLSFDLPAGQSLAIIGPSAAGKSSLVRAILGLWPLTQGEIRLDNTEIQHWNINELGPHIGYLPQDIELFEGTVAENIVRFGKNNHKKIIMAAQLAGIDAMIRHLPEGYDTPIGPGGSILSGGQRQLIGLARALYGQPKLVILDEPNANLDRQGEKALNRACQKLKALNTTLILVSHRKKILQNVDKILLLKNGSLNLYGPAWKVIAHLMGRKTNVLPGNQKVTQMTAVNSNRRKSSTSQVTMNSNTEKKPAVVTTENSDNQQKSVAMEANGSKRYIPAGVASKALNEANKRIAAVLANARKGETTSGTDDADVKPIKQTQATSEKVASINKNSISRAMEKTISEAS
ncbi:MAG: type I secretion system permease/ATPase [Gammaproteobacteria bacterium]|nr:type I secretion system permease/ATPase [Gammaproteobacteria bacterium]